MTQQTPRAEITFYAQPMANEDHEAWTGFLDTTTTLTIRTEVFSLKEADSELLRAQRIAKALSGALGRSVVLKTHLHRNERGALVPNGVAGRYERRAAEKITGFIKATEKAPMSILSEVEAALTDGPSATAQAARVVLRHDAWMKLRTELDAIGHWPQEVHGVPFVPGHDYQFDGSIRPFIIEWSAP